MDFEGLYRNRWFVRHDGRRVHLAATVDATEALCGARIKPWSRPDPASQVHAGCAKKAE